MRFLHTAARTQAAFEDENVVSFVGLVPVMRLAQDAGLGERVALGTSIGSNPAGKVATVVAGMVAGADSINDLDALRHGGMGELFGGVYAPSTLGSLRWEFSFGPPARLGRAGVAGRAGRDHAATAWRPGVDLRECGLAAAAGLRRPSRVRGSGTPRSAATRCCCVGCRRWSPRSAPPCPHR